MVSHAESGIRMISPRAKILTPSDRLTTAEAARATAGRSAPEAGQHFSTPGDALTDATAGATRLGTYPGMQPITLGHESTGAARNYAGGNSAGGLGGFGFPPELASSCPEPGEGAQTPGILSDSALLARCERLSLLYAIHAARKAHRPTRRLSERLRAVTAECV